jgi:hypothetical protein
LKWQKGVVTEKIIKEAAEKTAKFDYPKRVFFDGIIIAAFVIIISGGGLLGYLAWENYQNSTTSAQRAKIRNSQMDSIFKNQSEIIVSQEEIKIRIMRLEQKIDSLHAH